MEWNNPKKTLPKIGERVKVIVEKELIFLGNDCDDGSDWSDDGDGNRGIVMWMPLSEVPK